MIIMMIVAITMITIMIVMMIMSSYLSTCDTAKAPLARVPPDDHDDCAGGDDDGGDGDGGDDDGGHGHGGDLDDCDTDDDDDDTTMTLASIRPIIWDMSAIFAPQKSAQVGEKCEAYLPSVQAGELHCRRAL